VDEAELSTVSSVRIFSSLVGGPLEESTHQRILIIGAGGIGALLVTHLVRAYTFSNEFDNLPISLPIELTIMDGDTIELRNLPHQPYSADDAEGGIPKVDALVKQLQDIMEERHDVVKLIPISENFSEDTDLSDYVLVVVAVDRDEPRNLVHNKAEHWLDLRARGDGFVMWSSIEGKEGLEEFRNQSEGEAASCQLDGAVKGEGNIQFGFALAAAHGAQWILQWIRDHENLTDNRLVPPARVYTINQGDFEVPSRKTPENVWQKEYCTPCGHKITIKPVKKIGGMHEGKLWCNIRGPEVKKIGQRTKTLFQALNSQKQHDLKGALVRISKFIKCAIEDITEV
jgi:hypothetical protein